MSTNVVPPKLEHKINKKLTEEELEKHEIKMASSWMIFVRLSGPPTIASVVPTKNEHIPAFVG